MPEYNITLAYSALKPPPSLNCDRNQKTRALNPKDSREKYCQTRISQTNIVKQGYQIKIFSDKDIKKKYFQTRISKKIFSDKDIKLLSIVYRDYKGHV